MHKSKASLKKDFGTKPAATKAIEKAGLQHLPHMIQINRNGSTYRFEPVFFIDNSHSHYDEVRSFGFTVRPKL
jgi:hypothetical protein